ncbi:MAG: acyl-CoA dehydrogenase family protein [Deltaproteobacteria bacterium]|nr:acyl-CoA dehydrogenase family protein [Deltaproteobacteria bacterium]MBW2283881.1 acyl-CoA dehydrogenase family protein [Deltaproteobacteria bacterium]
MKREWLFDEEHEMFRESTRRWVATEVAPFADEWEEKGEFPIDLYRKAGELGFFAGALPEEYGGVGGDFRYHVVFSEELALSRSYGVSAGLGLHGFIALPPLANFGTDELKERYLAPGIRGEIVGALGVTEPDAGSDVGGLRTKAVRDGDHFVINGAKTFITNGVRADFHIVACKTDPDKGHRGISQIIVDKGTPGFTVSRKLDKLGWRASDTAELSFEDVRVPVGNLLGRENNGFYQIMHGFQAERLGMAVGSVAAAQHCFDITLKYAKERRIFGKPMGNFQINRHKFADMLTWIEAARRLCYHTIHLYVNGMECAKEIAMCKVFACEKAVEIADMCIQLHGGYGYMMEYEVQRIWRDQRIQPIGGGTSEVQKEIIGKLLGLGD